MTGHISLQQYMRLDVILGLPMLTNKDLVFVNKIGHFVRAELEHVNKVGHLVRAELEHMGF
jgi:hypothetical protein